jgi:uncharacterized heparinase superfamily protein
LFSTFQYYWHTLRYLRWIQIQERFRRRLISPKVNLAPDAQTRDQIAGWIQPAKCDQRMNGVSTFCFLNVEHSIESCADWNHSRWEKLWLYNLHYFDDLTAFDADQRVDWHLVLIQRWIDENPTGKGNGWEPYPSSLRIVNWIKWGMARNILEESWLHSLTVQVRYLTQNLETHLLGNHLFANAKALVYAGLFFDEEEAEDWYKTGKNLIEREVVEQVSADGGNFELSTMYHTIFLEDLLDIVNIHRVYERELPDGVEYRIAPMLNWLLAMCHPDGEISFFNDAALGFTPSVSEVVKYANRLGFESKPVDTGLIDLPASGYSRVAIGDAVALIDRAAVGPDYLPGHAHADTLSFELSLFGKRVVINSGTSVYGTGEQRQVERSTASHSTVVIDGENSSEVWAGFRVARRARVAERSHQVDDQQIRLLGCHDGYCQLKGKPKHCREWLFGSQSLLVLDQITGRGYHEVMVVFPLHPEATIGRVTQDSCDVFIDDHKVTFYFEGGGEMEVADSYCHPEFGLSMKNKQLRYRLTGTLPVEIKTRISW